MAPAEVAMLRTERLLLRRARATDLTRMHAIMSDADTMRFWSSLPHVSLDETQAWLARMTAPPDDVSDDFIVERDGRVIGKLGAWRLPEIGFIFARDIWGLGYAAEALAAFVAYRFAAGSDHLTADVDPRNAASLKLLTNGGFRITHHAARTWEIGGHWYDSVYLRLDRPPQLPPNTRASTPA